MIDVGGSDNHHHSVILLLDWCAMHMVSAVFVFGDNDTAVNKLTVYTLSLWEKL